MQRLMTKAMATMITVFEEGDGMISGRSVFGFAVSEVVRRCGYSKSQAFFVRSQNAWYTRLQFHQVETEGDAPQLVPRPHF